MALDILIEDFHGNIEKSIHLYIEEYDFIMQKLETVEGFELAKKVLSDFYGDNEIFLNELNNFKIEILALKDLFHVHCPQGLKDFISDLINLIDSAIAHQRTIKFIGD